eukprot:jgi/Mesvir1/6095/Mv25296-RA.1
MSAIARVIATERRWRQYNVQVRADQGARWPSRSRRSSWIRQHSLKKLAVRVPMAPNSSWTKGTTRWCPTSP